MTTTAIPPIAWPVDREIPDLDWQPPVGTRVISADDHWLEPPDLFVDRMPRASPISRTDGGMPVSLT